jgi:hypothetical protein
MKFFAFHFQVDLCGSLRKVRECGRNEEHHIRRTICGDRPGRFPFEMLFELRILNEYRDQTDKSAFIPSSEKETEIFKVKVFLVPIGEVIGSMSKGSADLFVDPTFDPCYWPEKTLITSIDQRIKPRMLGSLHRLSSGHNDKR